MIVESSLVFEKYKIIKNRLTLKNLARINYLVGSNGAGKSTILEILSVGNSSSVRVCYDNGLIKRSKNINSDLKYNLYQITNNYENYESNKDSYFELDENFEPICTKEDIIKFKNEHLEFDIQDEIRAITHWNPVFIKFKIDNNDLLSEHFYHILKNIYSFDNYEFEYTNPDIDSNKIILYYEKRFIKFINKISKIQFIEIKRDLISGRLTLVTNMNEIFDLNSFSSGQKKLICFYFELESIDQKNKLITYGPHSGYTEYEESSSMNFNNKIYNVGINHQLYYLIDEPEISLHPTFQKMISEMLNNYAFNNINFIIATHSPFIISEAQKYKDTKTYFIEDGQTIDKNNNLSSDESMFGYEGAYGILAMGKLIGVNPSDLTADIVFCEKTLSIILNSITDRFPPNKKIIFTPAMGGGDNKIIHSLAQILKFNFNNLNYYGIVDNCKSTIKSKSDNVTEKLDTSQNLEKQFSFKKLIEATNKIMILNYDELEKAYDLNLVNEFLKNIELNSWDGKKNFSADFLKSELKFKSNFKKGEIKECLAEFIKGKLDKKFIERLSLELYNYIYTIK
jgi:predicted ATPase